MSTNFAAGSSTFFRLIATTCLVASVVVTAWPRLSRAEDFEQPAPLEPQVAAASDEAESGLSGIRINEGWEIRLFAAEPEVANVVAFDIDPRGRFYVCETFRQNRGVTDNRAHGDQWLLADLASQTVQDRISYHKRLLGEAAITYAQHDDRIRRVIDSDGDGRADTSTVLASGFNRIEEGTGAGVLVRGEDVYYTCIPKLWKLIDADDDGVAERREVLSDGYGVRVAFRGHDMHGLIVGPDGRLYFSIGDRGYHVTTEAGELIANPAVGAIFRCELDGSGLEVFCNGLRNPQEMAFNQYGDLFTVDNNSDSGDRARVVQLLRGGDSGWRMYYQYLADRGPFNREQLWKPFHRDQAAYINPPIANFTDGPSGMAYYPGTGFGEQLNDQFFICDFRGGASKSGIRSFRLAADGAFHKLVEDAKPVWTCLATDAMFGPDGGLYVSDWVNGWDGTGKGRIYRISSPEHRESAIVREVQTLLSGEWSARDSATLAGLLSHADQRIRLEAQWELASRGEHAALLGVATAVQAGSVARLHGLWGADQIARRGEEDRASILATIRPLLADADPYVRAAAAKIAGERGDKKAVAAVRGLISDASSRVRYHATLAAGGLEDGAAFKSVVAMLEKNDNADPALRHAGVMFLSAVASPEQIGDLRTHASESLRRAAVVALRRLGSGQIAKFLADESPLVRQEATRAIHDKPIPVSLDDLASAITSEQLDDVTTLRVLNANYRIGSPQTATALAKFAATEMHLEAARIEALKMLKSWATPDPRDRVLNDFRALEPREAAVAADALRPLVGRLLKSEPTIRDMALDTASALGLGEVAGVLGQRVVDSKVPAASRARALESLARLDVEGAVNAARLVPSKPPGPVLIAALKVLAKNEPAASTSRFIRATSSSSRAVRQLGWDLLATVDKPEAKKAIAKAVEAYLDGELPPEVQLNVLEAAEKNLPEEFTVKLRSAQQAAAETDPLAPWLVALQGGEVKNGKKVFLEKTQLSCVRCHKVGRAGGEVGPELTQIGLTKDRRYLLEAICLPDATIAKGYETAVIVDYDGKIFTGIVKREDDETVELIQADGSLVEIQQDDVELRKKGKSSMPADLWKFMTRRELRDLVAYLGSLKTGRQAGETE